MGDAPYPLDKGGSRIPGLEGQYSNFCPDFRSDLCFRQIFDAVITSLDIYGGPQLAQEAHRRILVKDDDRINGFESSEYSGSIFFGDNGTQGSFEPVDRGVRVEAHDERVSQSARRPKVGDMPGMEEIEAAVGEDYTPPRLAHLGYPGWYRVGTLAIGQG